MPSGVKIVLPMAIGSFLMRTGLQIGKLCSGALFAGHGLLFAPMQSPSPCPMLALMDHPLLSYRLSCYVGHIRCLIDVSPICRLDEVEQ